jgi:predicted Zn-dependent protease
MGVVFITAGDLGKGIECFREAVSAAPADAVFCRNLGITLIQAGRLPEAEHVLRKLLQLHENDVPLLRMLCGTLLSQKRIDEATPLIDRLKKLDPESLEYDQWLAKAAAKSAEGFKASEPRKEGEGSQ